MQYIWTVSVEYSVLSQKAFILNWLWPSDAIWQQRSRSKLPQVMACCLTAPSHYLNQCWLIISKVYWHSNIHIRAISQEMPQPSITKIHLKITNLKFPRGHWVRYRSCRYTGLDLSHHHAYRCPTSGDLLTVLGHQHSLWWLQSETYFRQRCFWLWVIFVAFHQETHISFKMSNET